MKAKNNRVETYVAFLAAMLRDPDESDNCNAEAGKFFQLFNFLFEKLSVKHCIYFYMKMKNFVINYH